MPAKTLAFAVGVLVVLAGCGGASIGAQTDVPTDVATDTPTETSTSTPTDTPTPTATPQPPQNPWGEDNIRVVIRNSSERDLSAPVKEALEWWNENISRFTRFEGDFVLVPSGHEADIYLDFHDDIEYCGVQTGDLVGCAPAYDRANVADRSTIDIERGYNDSATTSIVKHELGHSLGLRHGEGPDFMTEAAFFGTLPIPNATEVANPWNQRTIQLYLDYGVSNLNEESREEYFETTKHAIQYYNGGADGWLDANVTFEIVDERSEADIVIKRRLIEDDTASTARVFGLDPDADSALESYSNGTITIHDNVDKDEIGWHVGYWLVYMMGGGPGTGNAPEPFDNDLSDRDSRFWQ